MSDEEFLEVFSPPERHLQALRDLVNEGLRDVTGQELIGTEGHLVGIADAISDKAPGAEVMMGLMNHARGQLGLPQFPTIEQYRRYQRLRGSRVGTT